VHFSLRLFFLFCLILDSFFIDFPWGVRCLDINLIVVSIFWTLLPLMCQLSERGNKLKNLERLWAWTILSFNWSLPTKLVSCSKFVAQAVWNRNWIGYRELGIAECHLAQWQVSFFPLDVSSGVLWALLFGFLSRFRVLAHFFYSVQSYAFGWKSRMW